MLALTGYLDDLHCCELIDKVEEYYDVYKEEFNSLLNLIQQKLQQQQNKQSNGSTPRRNFSTDIVSERLSIMVRKTFIILICSFSCYD